MNRYFLTLLIFLTFNSTYANNLNIGPITISNSAGSYYLNFTISWENSWRVSTPPSNYDAVWLFVKRRNCASLQWHHANLASQDSAHTVDNALFVDAYSDKKGVMLYRLGDGVGNISNANVRLKLDAPPPGNYDYQVFGIEMVYVPEGPFFVGDGLSTYTLRTGNTLSPFKITSELPLLISDTGNHLWAPTLYAGSSYLLPTTYPKGFGSFYAMKYEISQGQYADFLNSVTQDASQYRFDPAITGIYRYTINGNWPAITASVPDRACNWLSFPDLAAYLDWSALSPMTELEYEKLCRGDTLNSSVQGGFAWGGNTVTAADSITAGTLNQPNESVGTPIVTGSGLANYLFFPINGPLRCGFAAKSATSRIEAAASFYGAMELSGNVYERCYDIDSSNFPNTLGFRFTGNHGDGELSTTPSPGFSNQNWPGEGGDVSDKVVEFSSVGLRGGAFVNSNPIYLRVSDRSLYYFEPNYFPIDANRRSYGFGGRGVSRRQ